MRIAYLDCFAGISGDMFLGVLIDAGLDPKILHEATAALNLNASLRIEKVDRSGISSTKVHVLEDAKLAEENSPGSTHTHSHNNSDHFHEQQSAEPHSHQPKHSICTNPVTHTTTATTIPNTRTAALSA